MHPSHNAVIVQDWFEELAGECTLLRWPLQSPDRNPIEHLLNEVERAIRHINFILVESATHQGRFQIPQTTYQHPIEYRVHSKKNQCCIESKGWPYKILTRWS